jgi:hypothetical protein
MSLMLIAYSLDVVDPGAARLMNQSKPFFETRTTAPSHGLPAFRAVQ